MSEEKNVRAWWSKTPLPGNYGDILTPFYIFHETKLKAVHTKSREGVLFGAGSIIRLARNNCTIWGSGAISRKDKVNHRLKIVAVRGPRTRDILMKQGIKCPEIYGDPVLLLHRFINDKVDKLYEIGIIPHYMDYLRVSNMFKDKNVLVINILEGIKEVTSLIRQCNVIISSSLHGLISAHAYNIPYAWVKFSDRLTGDDTKFFDFAESVGVSLKHSWVKNPTDIGFVNIVNPKKCKEMVDKLWEVCPFRLDR